MAHHRLTTPLSEIDVRALRLEDTVSIDGIVLGIRGATQIRIFDHGVAPPAASAAVNVQCWRAAVEADSWRIID